MLKTKNNSILQSSKTVILSILLIFFIVPHTLEDFSLGEPAKNGAPAPVLAFLVAGLFALQGLALYWTGQKKPLGAFMHAGLGMLWALAAAKAQLPVLLAASHYRSGFISVFSVIGVIVVGILLFLAAAWESLAALRATRDHAE